MARQSTEMEYPSLGEYLRETRINLGMDLVTVAEETKISAKSLQAMEENNFATLPAEAFTRGFYTLYAKCLALDTKEILNMYMRQRPSQQKSGNLPTPPRTKLAQEVGSMAERPAFKPFSYFGLVLLLLLLLGGVICWYFSWNPATYLSQKLRSLEQPQRIEQVSTTNQTEAGHLEPNLRSTALLKLRPISSDLFGLSYPSIATDAIAQDMPETPISPLLQKNTSYINAGTGEKIKTSPPITGKRLTAADHAAQPQ